MLSKSMTITKSQNSTLPLIDRLQNLLDNELFESVGMLGEVYLNSPSLNLDENNRLLVLQMMADACHCLKQYRSAIGLYKDCIKMAEGLQSINNASGKNDDVEMMCESLPVSNQQTNELRLKLAKTYFQLGEFAISKNHLISIPLEDRNVMVWKYLAEIHHELGEFREIVWCCKNILKLEPLAVEMVVKLLQVGYDGDGSSFDFPLEEMEMFFESLRFQRSFQYSKAAEVLKTLTERNPRVTIFWLELAVANLRNGDYVSASMAFETARYLDPLVTKYIDKYAALLKGRGDVQALANLVSELSQSSPNTPETWVVIANHLELKNQLDKAIRCTERAIEIDNKHQEAYYLRGTLLLKLGKSMESLSQLKKAHKLYPDVFTFEALIETCSSMEKYREAIAVAKEMSNVLPEHPRALSTIASACFQSGDVQKVFILAFQKALSKDPNCLEAVLGIATILVSEHNFKAAIEHTLKYLPYHSTDALHAKIADIYLASKDYQSALHHYYIASSINPENERAKEGALEVEKELRGEGDDDMDEEDESLTQEDAYDFDEESLQ